MAARELRERLAAALALLDIDPEDAFDGRGHVRGGHVAEHFAVAAPGDTSVRRALL